MRSIRQDLYLHSRLSGCYIRRWDVGIRPHWASCLGRGCIWLPSARVCASRRRSSPVSLCSSLPSCGELWVAQDDVNKWTYFLSGGASTQHDVMECLVKWTLTCNWWAWTDWTKLVLDIQHLSVSKSLAGVILSSFITVPLTIVPVFSCMTSLFPCVQPSIRNGVTGNRVATHVAYRVKSKQLGWD